MVGGAPLHLASGPACPGRDAKSGALVQQGQPGCLIRSHHAEGDNVLYKGSCSLWNVEEIAVKD